MASDRIGRFTRADIDPIGSFRASDVDSGAPQVPLSSMTGIPSPVRSVMRGLQSAEQPFSAADQPGVSGTMLSDLAHFPQSKTEAAIMAAGALPLGKIAKAVGTESKALKLWHGSSADLTGKTLDPAKSLDTGPVAWLSASRGYAAEYGETAQHEVSINNPLDLRAHTTPGQPQWNRHAEKMVQEWVDLFRQHGVDAKLLSADYADEPARLWDLLHGGDRDFTRETNLGAALRASDYDALIVKEPHGPTGTPVDAYGILKPSALSAPKK